MEKLKILLVCSAGTSTSLVVEKMQQQAKKDNKEYKVEACGQAVAQDLIPNYDVILLSPGLRFNLKQFITMFPLKPIDIINSMAYGMLDANAIIMQAEKLMEMK